MINDNDIISAAFYNNVKTSSSTVNKDLFDGIEDEIPFREQNLK